MAREEFIDNLRLADRMLSLPRMRRGREADPYLSAILDSADLWLTPKSVEGFDLADFLDWPNEQREKLAREVAAFLSIAEQVPANKPATKGQSKHLEAAIRIVRHRILPEWLEAQQKMVEEATAAAKSRGWHVEKDEKEVVESLLHTYKAPRLRIRTQNKEVVLDPIARFGSGRRGIVDLAVMPTYETVYFLAFKDGQWQIISPHGTLHTRPFTQTTLVNTITKLSR